ARGDMPVVVAAAGRVLALGQRLDRLALMQPNAVDQHQLALSRGDRIIGLQCHRALLTAPWSLRRFDPLLGSLSLVWCRRFRRYGSGTSSTCRGGAAC